MPLDLTPLRRRRYLLLILPVLIFTAWVGSVTYAALDLVVAARAAQALAVAPLEADPEALDALVHRVRADVERLDRNLGWMMPVVARLHWLPGAGPMLAQAPPGLDLADALTALGAMMWEDMDPIYVQIQRGQSIQSLLPEALSAFAENQEAKLRLAEEAASACRDLDAEMLPARVGGAVAQLCEVIPLAVDGIEAADAFPRLIGVEAPQIYLVLALNEDELRPGGGFITGVGEVHVSEGQVLSMDFRDSYAVDDFSQPYPDPPDPLRAFMAIELLVFRDSNWSPDFPTSAQRAIELYRPGYPVEIAGVIGIDLAGVQALVEAVGPLTLPGATSPVSGSELLDYIHASWAPEDGTLDFDWWEQRKSFMSDVASVAIARIKSGDVDMTALARASMNALAQRHLQVYVTDAKGAAFLADQGWDGGLRHVDGDYLMAAEANLGYNKASSNIDRTLTYELDLRPTKPYARASLSYRHLSDQDASCVPEIKYDPQYREMTHRCYWAYTRLLVPGGAVLLDATKTPIPAEQMIVGQPWLGEPDITDVGPYDAFGQGFLLPTQDAQTIEFVYELPDRVVKQQSAGHHHYSLYVQKQPGIRSQHLILTLRLPEDAILLSTRPDADTPRDGVLFYETMSESDIVVSVEYLLEEVLAHESKP